MRNNRTENRHSCKALLAVLLVAVMLILVVSPSSDASTSVTCEGLDIVTYDDSPKSPAGGSVSLIFTLSNTNSSGNISVNIGTSKGNSPASISASDTDFTIKAKDYKQITVNLNVDRYADANTYTPSVTVEVYNHQTEKSGTVTIPITLTVVSAYESSGQFNKILGVFENNLPSPFNSPAVSAIITLILWIIFAAIAYTIVYILAGRIFRGEEESIKDVRHLTGRLVTIIMITYGITETAIVYGANEFVMRSVQDIALIAYTFIGGYIAWNIYKNLVKHIFHKMERDNKVEGVDTSLIPLFNLIGQIIICTVTAAILLTMLNVNLIGILTGAGIIALAISMGAQNVLSEFFSGVTLLITRPFRENDMVRIGSDQNVYQVIKVRLMNSEFKNWASLEHLILPNSKVGSSSISNLTKGSMAYRLFIYYDVGYDSDLDLVKEILLKTANDHPQVIKDGSFDKPGTRVTSFDSTTIQVRLAAYIFDFRDNVIVTDELLVQGYQNLENAGIDIPYDRIDIHVKLADENE